MVRFLTDPDTGGNRLSSILCVFLSSLVSAFCAHAAENQSAGRSLIEYLGTAEISGDRVDRSGLSNNLENGEPHSRLGGISALEYTGKGSLYIALPDRGPDDGATGYACRFHLLDITVSPSEGHLLRICVAALVGRPA